MTTIEKAIRLVNDFKGDKQRAYEFAVSHSVARDDDDLFSCFGMNIEETRSEYNEIAEYIKNNM